MRPLSLASSAPCWFNRSHVWALLHFNSHKFEIIHFSTPSAFPASLQHPHCLFYCLVSLFHLPDISKSRQLRLLSQPHAVLMRAEMERERASGCRFDSPPLYRKHLLFTRQLSWSQTWWKTSCELIRAAFAWESMGRKSENDSLWGGETRGALAVARV